jgi:predicted nucleic acid-binding protein
LPYHIADRFAVVLDACVLHPFRMRDVLLRFCHAGLFRAHWTDEIIAEWTASVLAKHPDAAASLESQQRALRAHFEDAWVTGYEPLVLGLTLPDPDDRHVLAAAIRCGAQHIITDNRKDFPSDVLEEFDVEAISADEFLMRTFELYPDPALAVLKALRAALVKPPFGPSEFIMDLTRKGMPRLASALKAHRDQI